MEKILFHLFMLFITSGLWLVAVLLVSVFKANRNRLEKIYSKWGGFKYEFTTNDHHGTLFG